MEDLLVVGTASTSEEVSESEDDEEEGGEPSLMDPLPLPPPLYCCFVGPWLLFGYDTGAMGAVDAAVGVEKVEESLVAIVVLFVVAVAVEELGNDFFDDGEAF